ncbi:ABC transporter substrate-binding protein [Bradyrhizobium sp. G127]|jgi:ABC-type branched-subunit amino acid transport system substrate-binding protein|uniref:ABC transporter substrate-binding protein n=1 Tax=Bradyrhizobium sp. G127 TaxID=2904800 RepID=UPI001F2CA32F|nr:ABC transporter substrate-binding protein [Bradyrhizobium sp. G127]MCF2524761.1 ABC transporter substrate-binding protein [Bradyrhizobium sp. G127]
MRKVLSISSIVTAALIAMSASGAVLAGEKKYDVGATDTEIKIGNTMPYSGPGSAWGLLGKAEAAYFEKVNAEGGVNGRKIKFISYDDAYSPPKTVEQVRRLVENDEVLLLFSTFGVPTNTAIHKYVNARKVPHLFVGGGGSKWNDPKNFPWTTAFQPSFLTEGRIYGQYIAANHPDGKIAVLYQNDDYGKDILNGFKQGLGTKAKAIVAEASYEVSVPTVDSQVVQLKASGADIFMNFAGPKFAAQAIRKIAELGWKPVHILNIPSASIGSVIKPAGFDISQGVISGGFLKDATDPALANDPAVKAYLAFIEKYYPGADVTATANTQGYVMAQTMVQVLKLAGDDLTRENIMRQATNLKGLELDMLLPGIRINTAPDDLAPIKSMQLRRLVGERWETFGGVIEAAPMP